MTARDATPPSRVIPNEDGSPRTYAALVGKLNMSARTLERLFDQHLGRTAREYLLEIRVERARQLLRHHPEMPLAHVGELCGFAKPGQFSETFKNRVGQSPRDFRGGRVTERPKKPGI